MLLNFFHITISYHYFSVYRFRGSMELSCRVISLDGLLTGFQSLIYATKLLEAATIDVLSQLYASLKIIKITVFIYTPK